MASASSPDYEHSPVPVTSTTEEQSKAVKNVQVGTISATPSLTEKTGRLPAQRPGWTSTYLQNGTLLGFAVAFLALLLSVIALAIVDAKRDGIATARSSEHYLWTYGPTAVLVVVAALWNQVEYRTKDMMPWALLQQGSTPASTTLFLDYVSPGKPEALWTSLRKSHWPVAITIVNSFLITLLTVASTGLLVLQSTPFVHQNCRLNVTNDFVTSFDSSTTGSAAILATLAITNDTIPYPPGTSSNAAFQNLAPPTSLSGFDAIEVEGLASTFYGRLDCEVATLKSGYSGCADRQCRSLNTTLEIISPTCDILNYNLTYACSRGLDAVSCDLDTLLGIGCDSYADGHDKNRLVFMVGEMKQDLGGASRNKTKPIEVVVGNTTVLVCEPKYNITDVYVVMDRDGNIRNDPDITATTSRAQQFSAWDLVDGLLTASNAAGIVLDQGYAYISVGIFPWTQLKILFYKWVATAHPSSNLKDPNVLQSHASEMFSMATAQMAKQNLMRSSTDTTIGTCRATEDRLRVRGLSLYFMGAVLLLLMLLTISLLYIAPRNYSSRDPSSIGGLALVLSQSPSLLSRLSGSGSTDLKTMKSQLDNIQCQALLARSGQEWRFSIDLSSTTISEEQDGVADAAPGSETTYWRPMSLGPVFKATVIVVLLVLVVVLEVLYAVSQKNNGLTEVDPQQYQRFAWVYIPAIVMLTVQTLVGTIAFSSLMIFPYSRLRSGQSNARNVILQNYAAETAIKSLWKSIAAKHIIVACMALAMLLAPLLTIAVSGLYTAQATSEQTPITMSLQNQLNSSFTPNGIDDVDARTAGNNIGLLLTQNFTFPRWTYDELAFPEAVIEIPPTVNISLITGGNITVLLPGIRSDLYCSVASVVPTNFTDTLGDEMYRKANVTAFDVLGTYDDGTTDIRWPSPGMNPFGFFVACGNVEHQRVGNTFCGALGTSEVNWNAFTCSSVINQLDVEITLDASTLEIITASPDETTIRLFSNQSLTQAQRNEFPSSMIPSLFGYANFGERYSAAGYYDPAFQAVIYGLGTRDNLDKFPMDEYMSEDGIEKVFAEFQHVHRTITAQSADLIRVPLNTSSPLAPPASVNAMLINPNVYRLHQSAVSTRILDGLLVAIALCIALSFFLMDTRKVLYKNPTSIAGGASLIAEDSRMLGSDVLPEGVQWYTDAELQAKKVWDGLSFRLGWWDSNGPTEQGGGGKYFKLDAM